MVFMNSGYFTEHFVQKELVIPREQAYNMLLKAEMDYLVMSNYLISRS